VFRLKLTLRLAAAMAIVGGILFGSAGRIDLPFFWAYLAVLAGFSGAALLTVSRGLLEERRKPAESGRDNLALLRITTLLVFLTQWIVAGLDVGRLHRSDTVPGVLRTVGLMSFVAVFVVWSWAMRANPFFSTAVRIQRERGHHVVSSGPYRFVRHPGYAALVLLGWGGPIALGSWWAVVPHFILVALFARRAALEDRMLREELDGYSAYAAAVRYRWLPGIW